MLNEEERLGLKFPADSWLSSDPLPNPLPEGEGIRKGKEEEDKAILPLLPHTNR